MDHTNLQLYQVPTTSIYAVAFSYREKREDSQGVKLIWLWATTLRIALVPFPALLVSHDLSAPLHLLQEIEYQKYHLIISRHAWEDKHTKGCVVINKALGTKRFQAGCSVFHNSGLNSVWISSYPKEVVSNTYTLQQAAERKSLGLLLIALVCPGEQWLWNVFLVILSIWSATVNRGTHYFITIPSLAACSEMAHSS